MTEDEARTKLCCGPPAVATATYFGRATVDVPMRCIASLCMAWRQQPNGDMDGVKRLADAGQTIDAIKALRVFDMRLSLKEAKDIVQARLWPVPGDGYCGLAGRPE